MQEVQPSCASPIEGFAAAAVRNVRTLNCEVESAIQVLPLRTRAGNFFDIEPNSLGQISIIEYSIGAPIGWHRDIARFGVVLGVSLGSACRMRFRKYSRAKKSARDEMLSMELQPRSIYLMSGASRESWQHSISPVKEHRYSIMIRTLRAQRS